VGDHRRWQATVAMMVAATTADTTTTAASGDSNGEIQEI